MTHVQRWRHGIAQYEVGHAARVKLIEERGRALGLFGAGSALRGVGVNDIIRDGKWVAEQIVGS
jgi:protoporphyrinogen oxidase